jgi:twinkle protein
MYKTFLWFLGETDKDILLTKIPEGMEKVIVFPEDDEGIFQYISDRWPELQNADKHVFLPNDECFDFSFKQEICRRIGAERVFVAQYPPGHTELEDLEVIDLSELAEKAKPIPIDGIYKAHDFRENLDHLYDNGETPGASCGFVSLDRYYTVKQGQLTIVTGIPSHGKSEFTDAILVNLAQKHGLKFAVFSPENYPTQRHIVKLVRKYIGKAYGATYKGTMSKVEKDKGIDFVDKHFSFINSPEITFPISKILELTRISIAREGINGLLIDPWNEVDHARPQNLSETEYISQTLTEVRKFARQYNIHIWIVAHPTKRKKEYWKEPPILYDISGSAHWFNKADNGITVYREDVTNNNCPTMISITKVRFRENGRPGDIELRYNMASGRYYE